MQAKLDQAKLRTDMLNGARLLKAHKLSNGKLGVDWFLLGRRHRNFLAAALGDELQAGVPYYGAAAETASVSRNQGAAADPLCRERRHINAMWPAFEAALKAARRPLRGPFLPGHSARLSQQLHAEVCGSCCQPVVGSHLGVFPQAPDLIPAGIGRV